jgi:hypothetical protein
MKGMQIGSRSHEVIFWAVGVSSLQLRIEDDGEKCSQKLRLTLKPEAMDAVDSGCSHCGFAWREGDKHAQAHGWDCSDENRPSARRVFPGGRIHSPLTMFNI